MSPAWLLTLPSPTTPCALITLISCVSPGEQLHSQKAATLAKTATVTSVVMPPQKEPLAWLTDVLERMVSGRTKAHELERLLSLDLAGREGRGCRPCLNSVMVRRRLRLAR
jgi:hypothetical protein